MNTAAIKTGATKTGAVQQAAFWRPMVVLAAIACAGCSATTAADGGSAWPLARASNPASQEVDKSFMTKVAKDPFPTAQQRGLLGM